MKKIIRRGAAATLAAVTLVTSAAVPVRAAAPRVQVDETMYVNLDYYGTATQINVVKGCTTNGLTEYTDYGTYDKVVNMTDDTAPEIGDGTVTWKLPEKNSRFYYQCTMPKNSVDLPWTFDVSYKLNGVEADASKLAGASGLVEVNVKATPNEEAKAYYKNNMVLTVLVPVDMEKCYSVDAPGAQVQSVGSYQAAMFAALPGEDGDFTVRVGTDKYENIGVIMMMVPGTLDELKSVPQPLLMATTTHAARRDGNIIVHVASGVTHIGPARTQDGDYSYLADVLQKVLPDVAWHNHIRPQLWRKLAVNCVINPLTALWNCPNGELKNHPQEVASLCAEVAAVVEREGLHTSADDLRCYVEQVIESTAENISSMLQDVRALRHTEIDYITGYLLKRARAHGIAVPENARLYDLVKRKESEYERVSTDLPRPW